MLGLVSTNVRQLSLAYEDGWKILAVLEKQCEQDVDDIQDIADETSILIEEIKDRISFAASACVTTSFVCSANTLDNVASIDCRIIFRRKESA